MFFTCFGPFSRSTNTTLFIRYCRCNLNKVFVLLNVSPLCYIFHVCPSALPPLSLCPIGRPATPRWSWWWGVVREWGALTCPTPNAMIQSQESGNHWPNCLSSPSQSTQCVPSVMTFWCQVGLRYVCKTTVLYQDSAQCKLQMYSCCALYKN